MLMPLRKLKIAVDTSAFVSLGILRQMPLMLEYFDFYVPMQVRKELEEISKAKDIHGRSSSYTLNFIGTGKIKAVEISSSDPGEEAVMKLAKKINADYILMDDISAARRFTGPEIKIRFSPFVLYLLTRFKEINTKEAVMFLEKMRIGRDWKDNLIYSFARELLFK